MSSYQVNRSNDELYSYDKNPSLPEHKGDGDRVNVYLISHIRQARNRLTQVEEDGAKQLEYDKLSRLTKATYQRKNRDIQQHPIHLR
jgi:hypothetical protein